MTWTIKMRPGVTFHNGKTVTAEDAWFSIQRVADPKAPLSGGGQLLPDPRLRVHEGGRRDHAPAGAEDARTRSSTRCWRSTPSASSRPTSTSRTPSAPARSPTSRSNPARPAPSPSTPTTGATRPSSTSCRSRTSPTTTPRSTRCRPARSRPSTTCPTTSSTPSRGPAAASLVSETGAWVPFTMRVDQAPFNDVKVRQAMRLIVDRQQMIDQALSGYGSLGNDLYAPFDVGLRQRPAPARAGHRPGQVAAHAGRPGRPPGRAVHRRRHRLGGPGGGQPVRRAGQGGRRRGQGHQEDAVLRRRLPVLHLRPGLLEHP